MDGWMPGSIGRYIDRSIIKIDKYMHSDISDIKNYIINDTINDINDINYTINTINDIPIKSYIHSL